MNFRLTEHDKALLTGPLSPKGRNWPLLGLPDSEAGALFNGGNSFADILMLLEGFARQDGITLPPELYLPLGEPELTEEEIVAALDDLALVVAP